MIGPVYTETTACQDCYRCLRHCPVKAIRIIDGKAEVQKELCLNCGRCLNECPAEAKKIRSDIARVRQTIRLGGPVVASLAPSWVAEFPDDPKLIGRLYALGFTAVEETATGARLIAEACRTNPNMARGISRACPVIVEYIARYRPSLLKLLSPAASPLEVHAGSVKQRFGEETTVVFIGPCVAKKLEADNPSSPVDLAITFRELKEWMDRESNPENSPAEERLPFEHNCEDFFLEGGFLKALEKSNATGDIPEGIAISGLDSILASLDGWSAESFEELPPLELLACSGGCQNGPGMTLNDSPLERRLKGRLGLETAAGIRESSGIDPLISALVARPPNPAPALPPKETDEADIRAFLTSLGRPSLEDDPDCGSCGYESCRNFAKAVLNGMAEESMCISVMRRRAQKQSDALMQSLPLGAVIADRNLCIRECNARFLRLFTDLDFDPPKDVLIRIRGRSLANYMEDTSSIRRVLSGEIASFSGNIASRNRIYRATVFPVDGENSAGAVFQDITSPQVKKETVIKKAEEVIQKNLSSVQQIASLLGENAAETQLILDSLIGAFNE